jgi:beta-glucosidase
MRSPVSIQPLPPDFLWGWAIAGTEAEGGGLRNQWTRWSDANAERLAAAATAQSDFGGGPATVPLWEAIAAEATDPANYRVGRGCEMWTRYPEDFALAAQLGFDAGQISVEWSRIEPEPGKWDDGALGHYRDMISCLRHSGQEPFVALWHFGNPLWFEDRGGWRWRGAPEAFARYCRHVAEGLGDLVTFYLTVAEPKVYSARAHLFGWWPPQERGLRAFFTALNGMVAGHRAAYSAVKSVRPGAQLGAAVNDLVCSAASGVASGPDRLLAWAEHPAQDRLFRSRIVGSSDWLGLNYYSSRVVRRGRFLDTGQPRSDMGWGLNPGGITAALRRVSRFGKPIYITEFGVADRADRYRYDYIDRTLQGVRAARAAGADVRGAFYWSLLDNFEWDKGYWPRFGVVEVDRATLARSPRPSAWRLRQLVGEHRQPSPGADVDDRPAG